jgi:hypothetical protein
VPMPMGFEKYSQVRSTASMDLAAFIPLLKSIKPAQMKDVRNDFVLFMIQVYGI